jgi:parallel beta helix pectate lyase-like protein
VDHTTVSGNQPPGAAILNVGAVTIYRSTITKNFVGFSPITNQGTMTIAGSTISGNAGEPAGGVENDSGGTLTIRASTISRNDGGGIANGVSVPGKPAATLRLYDVIVKDNFDASPAGLWNGQVGVAALHDSRVVRNNATAITGGIGGILNQYMLTLDHTIVRYNIPNNCVGCGHPGR